MTTTIELSSLVRTDGKALDLSHIYMIGVELSDPTSIYIKQAFLSDDGVTPTSILETNVEEQNKDCHDYYDLTGRKVKNPHRGVYILNGKKIFVE